MNKFQFFVIPIGNEQVTEEREFHPRAPVIKYQSKEYWDYKASHKDSVAPSDKIEKAKEGFVAPSAEIDKTAK